MTGKIEDNLEKQLGALTAWSGDSPRLWRRALKAAGRRARPRRSWLRRIRPWRFSGKLAACVAVVGLVTTAVIVNLMPSGIQRDAAQKSPEGARITALRARANGLRLEGLTTWSGNLRRAGSAMKTYVGTASTPSVFPSLASPQEILYQYADNDAAGDAWAAVRARGVTPKQFISPSTIETRSVPTPSPARQSMRRHVVRKATIELTTGDVRAAFLKAAMIVHEAGGEYVQNSVLTGSGDGAFASLTLRVAADRLSDVLNELRQLGDVYSERRDGQDVTGQVVDLEARLGNEQRIEAELLRLLENRRDAPLDEILQLRDKLGEVRQEVERLTGQREHIGRLVSLATVLVIIQGDGALTRSAGTGLGAYFADACGAAWNKGLVFLADTLATILSILVGGLIWWLLLLVAVIVGIRRWRRSAATRID